MSYPGESFAAQQRAGYPDLATIRLTVPPDRAFQMVDAAAQKLGWEVTYRDPENGILEATQVSRIFEFVDDIVVRIRPEKGLSVIDVRSRSRLGRGDLGANAERIRALQQALSR